MLFPLIPNGEMSQRMREFLASDGRTIGLLNLSIEFYFFATGWTRAKAAIAFEAFIFEALATPADRKYA
ncbi:hypothetical protein THOM_2849 [Trachipleistophora hominis]|uniref:Uncharacterized protein n=1 Tax=Trachipleistophora hominis TaxID=72359 RepID=L7JU26_TRAHO|nr:hypothetical protein THOM_2849 [Trachipleistophora hominis]